MEKTRLRWSAFVGYLLRSVPMTIPVYVVWESYFPPESAAAGLEVTEAIWRDMPAYVGYIGHELIQDVADPGHLLVVSRWASQEAADDVRDRYAGNPNARRANSLVREPRRRIVCVRVER